MYTCSKVLRESWPKNVQFQRGPCARARGCTFLHRQTQYPSIYMGIQTARLWNYTRGKAMSLFREYIDMYLCIGTCRYICIDEEGEAILSSRGKGGVLEIIRRMRGARRCADGSSGLFLPRLDALIPSKEIFRLQFLEAMIIIFLPFIDCCSEICGLDTRCDSRLDLFSTLIWRREPNCCDNSNGWFIIVF